MSAPLESWKVLPHGQLAEVEDDARTVMGTIRTPVGDVERRITAARLLDGLGRMAWLVVPGDDHRLDAKPWLQRSPALDAAAPAGAREKARVIRGVKGTTIGVNDLIANIRHEHGFTGWMLRMMGLAGDEPDNPGVRRLAMVKDSNALSNLRCVPVSHGELRRLSESLR